MKLGIDSYSFHFAFGVHPDFTPHQKMTLFHFINRVKELKLDGFQIDPMHLESRDDDYLNGILSYTKEKDLFLKYETMGVESTYLMKKLQIAKKLASEILRTFIGFDRYDKKVNIRHEINQALVNLSKVKHHTEELDIKSAIENLGNTIGSNIQERRIFSKRK